MHRNAAPVDADVDGVLPGGSKDRLEDARLEGVAGVPIRFQRPPLRHARGDEDRQRHERAEDQ